MGEAATPMLEGVRVVEFAQNAAVPQCARLLAGMGADVVKVEPTAGDAMRHLAPIAGTDSRAYATINPGKRAVALDLGAGAGRAVTERLIRWADIVLVGLKASDLERFGLDWPTIHEVNPRAVAMIFSSHGPQGPDAAKSGYDMLIQAVSGLGWSMSRSADGAPMATRPAMIDFGSGNLAAAGVLAALRHRDQTGVGQRVDASLLGTALSHGTPMMSHFEVDRTATDSLVEEIDLMRAAGSDFDELRAHWESRAHAGAVFKLYVRPYRTADGFMSVAGFSPALMQRFHDVTGLPRPGHDPADADFIATIEKAEALFAAHTTAHWLEALGAVGYPCAPFNHPVEAITNPQAEANGYVVDLDHPTIGSHRVVGMPIGFSGSPVAVDKPAPRLGEHTTEVLGEIGLSTAEINQLLNDGVVAELAASPGDSGD